MSVRYCVTCTLRDDSVTAEYIEWLQTTHVKDVVREGGALSAEVISLGLKIAL